MNRTLVALATVVLFPVGCFNNDRSILEASGTIEGTDVRIASEVMGKVKEIRVEEGIRVEKGDTLVIIDDTDYRLQLRQAEAAAAVARAHYQLALEGPREEEIVQAEAMFRNAEADYKRMKELLAAQTVTQKQYDDAYARYVAAEQTYRRLVRGSRKAELDAARARWEQAKAQVEALNKRLRDCVVLAPLRGTVTARAVEPGEVVSVGATLLKLTNLDKLKLTIYLNEQDLPRVKLGQRAEVRTDGLPERTFEGTVTYISPVAEFTPKNVQTKDERTKLVFGVK
ncbi:MAG TPA: efflux RND transporter periplasmic adaptor subunit, partial [Bacteroidota bacterium]|nr:efflux RND transporter periplasmic adaptor subunit [Bacteroidota bacterium]